MFPNIFAYMACLFVSGKISLCSVVLTVFVLPVIKSFMTYFATKKKAERKSGKTSY